MGVITDAFGWMLGVQKKSINDLDIAEMESKLRATARLGEMWERELKKADKEYRDAVSIEANAGRSPIARKLSLQKGAITAKRIKTLSSAVNMLNKMRLTFEQLKDLKKFYHDLSTTMQLPKGISVEEFVKQVYAMGDQMEDKKAALEQMIDSLDSVGNSISQATGDDEIEKLMSELNELYDEYNTKLAMNDTQAADEVRVKIELKKAEMDKQMGVKALV
ncbi:MAG: hypothetical protein IJS08_17310 [Victivallales bacterium]|nr:hypothetical protein [Victivallales bacterium]